MIDWLLASDLRSNLQDIFVISLIALALLKGRGPERATIAVWVLCFEIPNLVYREILGHDIRLTGVDSFLVMKDVAACVLWVLLALYANRNYPLWIAGVQLLAVGAHVARGLLEAIAPISYAFLIVAPGWIALVIMAIGFTRHAMRERKYGAYRDWRTSPVSGGPPSLLHSNLN